MTLRAELFVDHTCPFSYMAFTSTRRTAADLGIEMRWRTLPIVGASPSLTQAERAMHVLRQEADWPRVEALAGIYGLVLGTPVRGVDGRPAAAAAHWVGQRRPALADAVHEALFGAYFTAGVDLSSTPALEAVVGELGMDPAGLAPALAAGAMDTPLAEDARVAAANGVTAVPALVAAGYLLLGAHPREVLERTLEQVQRAAAAVAGDPG